MNRPDRYLNWTDGAAAKVQAPPANFLLEGWDPGQAPPAQYMNWITYITDQWIQYLDSIVTTGEPDQVIRLINGGFWAFQASNGLLSWSLDANLSIAGVPDSNNIIPAGHVNLSDGQVAYVNFNPPIILEGTTTNGASVVSQVNFLGNLVVGMMVTGPGIPAGTLITAVGKNSFQISNPANADGTASTLIASNTQSLTVLVSDGQAFIPTFTTILLARRSGPKVYLGVNTGQMLLRDGEYKPLLGSGYFTTFEAPAGQNLTAGQIVYIAPANDGGRTAGAVYPLDAGATNGQVRSTFGGMVVSNVAAGANALLLYNGFYAQQGLTPGAQYYADPARPGGITGSIPSGAGQKIIPVGVAVTATSLLVSGTQGGVGFFSQPIFKSETLTSGDNQNFPLSAQPLNSQSMYVYVNGLISPSSEWTMNGQTLTFNSSIGPGQIVYVEYILAQQTYLQGYQETPQPTGDPLTFTLGGSPINQAATSVYVDGGVLTNAEWSLVSGSICKIVLNSPLVPGQSIYVKYLSPVGIQGSSGGGGAASGQNIGQSGVGLYSGSSNGILQFKKLLAGAGISIVDNGDGTVSLAAGAARTSTTEYYTLGATDIQNGFITLNHTPVTPQNLLLDVVGGPAQAYGPDFSVNGAVLTWSQELENEFSVGDILRVHYTY